MVPTAIAVWMLACGCGSGSSAPRLEHGDRSSHDVVELVVKFSGKAAAASGTSHEWYVPATGEYRVVHTTRGGTLEAVYDGASITLRDQHGVFREEGDADFLRFITKRPNIFESPGIVFADAYLGTDTVPANLSVTSDDGGHVLDVDWHYTDEGVDTHFRATVTVVSRVSPGDQPHPIFRSLAGTPIGGGRQSPPGTPPSYGERAYWFGDNLGPARAATALETWGVDPGESDEAQPAEYRTIYRMPVSALPEGVPPSNTENYPGLGDMADTDIWVNCRPAGDYLPGVDVRLATRQQVTIANGDAATLYTQRYSRGDAPGVMAAIVIGDTVCSIDGLISVRELVGAAGTIAPL
jgi:hypothetical protein